MKRKNFLRTRPGNSINRYNRDRAGGHQPTNEYFRWWRRAQSRTERQEQKQDVLARLLDYRKELYDAIAKASGWYDFEDDWLAQYGLSWEDEVEEEDRSYSALDAWVDYEDYAYADSYYSGLANATLR